MSALGVQSCAWHEPAHKTLEKLLAEGSGRSDAEAEQLMDALAATDASWKD